MEIMERESKIEEMRKAIEEIISKTVMTATEMSFTAIYDIDSKIMDLEQIEKIQNVLKSFCCNFIWLQVFGERISITIEKKR